MKGRLASGFLRFLAVALCVLALTTVAHAQSFAGVSGVVFDPSKGVVPDVAVTLTNPATGFSASANTNSSGQYEFLQVPPANGYLLTFTKTNFRVLKLENIDLGVGLTETRDAALEIGETKQTVEVSVSGEATLNTADASIGNVITSAQVQELPSLIRTNAAVLLQLQPGVQVSGSDSQYGSVTGSRADTANITLDGLDVNDETIGQAFVTVNRAPIDSVSEVRTIVGGADSTYGRSSGAQIDLVTKSGTNAFHGSLHEYNRVSAYAANDWFNNFTGTPRPGLIRNQFGGDLGGPIIKEKLFFFFDYEARRDNIADQEIRTVPLAALRNGEVNYINNGPGCDSTATIANNPGCISTLPVTGAGNSVQGLDPSGIGGNAALISYIDGRYPISNFVSAGDGVNTGGYLFNFPLKYKYNTYVGRMDYNLSAAHKLFARASWDRDNIDDAAPEFPVDGEPSLKLFNHSRSYVIGDTWLISPTIVNNIFFGVARSVLDFPVTSTASEPNSYGFGPLSAPLPGLSSQGRNVSVPEIRDVLTWTKGKHTLEFGTDLKFIQDKSNLNNSINGVTVGLGGNLLNLGGPGSSLHPTDLYQNPNDPGAMNQFDSAYTFLLGHFSEASANYNYDLAGNPQTLYTPANRKYIYNEYELFAQDTWRVRSDLTFSAGLRWQYHAVPYEANGFEGISNLDEQQLFGARLTAAAQGISGNDAAPLVSYSLGGPKNHGPGYYNPDYRDFAPRIGLAYTPSFNHGILGALFGDRKSAIRLGAGMNYDRILSTLSFELDQQNFIFSNTIADVYDSGNPPADLNGDFRFTAFNAPPPATPAPTIDRTVPFTPNVDGSGNPIGLANGGFPSFFQLNRTLKTPYVISMSLGIQRELPHGFSLEADYFGKLGRRLLADGDAAQTLNFKDATSGQFLYGAFGNVQKQIQTGTAPGAVSPQPWFENQISQAVANFGLTCPTTAPFFGLTAANCTQLAAQVAPYFPVGDVSSEILVLTSAGILPPNVGLDAQTGSAGYVGNYGSSNYNGLLVTLRKKVSSGLQFDFNYTYSHAIDNVSDITNNANQYSGTGQFLVCDLRNLRVCRSSSDFDARHTVSANFVYYLPVGSGQRFLSGSGKVLNALVGGWGTSGIVVAHTGYPFNLHTGTFPINFTQDAPPVFVGTSADVAHGIHVDQSSQTVQYFNDPTNGFNAFAYPFGGGTGDRNSLRAPGFWNVDMALLKNFSMPWSDRQKLQFRAEAFNLFNHPSFAPPSDNTIANPGTFGNITSTESTARQLQLALRYDF
jgi:hypothetical protein